MSDDPLGRLIAGLDLERLDRDLFLGDPGSGRGRLFGGMVAAQSVMAAGLTVDEGRIHSLHAYFLRPGRHGVPLRLVVDRIRDGRTFTTRRVVAHQAGEAIFNLSASFTRPEGGIAHQYGDLPDTPAPEGLPDWEDERARVLGDSKSRRRDGPVEIRVCDPDDPNPGVRQDPTKRIWMRPRGTLPDDALVHAAVLVYASDRTLLSTATRPHGLSWGRRRSASLDHAVWIHRPIEFSDWMLYASESPIAHDARGLVMGKIFRRDGTHVASVAQEGLIRIPR